MGEMPRKPFVSRVGADPQLWVRVEQLEEYKIDLNIVDRDGEKAWTAELSDPVVKQFYEQYGLAAEDYWKIILTQLQIPSDNFHFQIRGHDFCIEKLSTNQVKLIYAKLHLHETDFHRCLISLTETLLDTQTELKKKNDYFQKEVTDISRDRTILHQQLEKFTEGAVEKEELLLSNFLALINAKKDKIQRLQDELEGNGEMEGRSGDSVYDADTDVDEDKSGGDTPPKTNPKASTSGKSASKKAKKTDATDDFDDVMDL